VVTPPRALRRPHWLGGVVKTVYRRLSMALARRQGQLEQPAGPEAFWKEDSSTLRCTACNKAFGVTRRRYVCTPELPPTEQAIAGTIAVRVARSFAPHAPRVNANSRQPSSTRVSSVSATAAPKTATKIRCPPLRRSSRAAANPTRNPSITGVHSTLMCTEWSAHIERAVNSSCSGWKFYAPEPCAQR